MEKSCHDAPDVALNNNTEATCWCKGTTISWCLV